MWINQEVVATAATQIGYRPGGSAQGKFCDWFGRNTNWCVMGASWSFYDTLEEYAKEIIGVQAGAPNDRGWSWTVGLREWLQVNGTKVDIRNAKPGTVLFFKYPAEGDRDEAVVNHGEIIESANDEWVTTIGFNTAEPGKADTLTNRGVYRVTYAASNRRFVDAYYPPFHLYPGIGYVPNGRTVEQVQEIVGVTPNGIYDINTRIGAESTQAFLNTVGNNLTVDGLWGWGTNAAFDKYMAQVTSSRLAGKDRYATAVEVSKAAWDQSDTVYLLSGRNFPDALAMGASLSAESKLAPGPILLVGETLQVVVRDEIIRLRPTHVVAIGGDNIVTPMVVQAAVAAAQSAQ